MLPTVEAHPFLITDHADKIVRAYADRLLSQPRFQKDSSYAAHMPESLGKGASLVIDDFSDVANFYSDPSPLEQRARLRAEQGDVVVTMTPPDDVFDRYVELDLGLGQVDWVSPSAIPPKNQLALECWRSRSLRRTLVQKTRQQNLRYIHPHMGNQDVWQLAQLLSSASHLPLQVIAPTPAVAAWANNKVEFVQTAADLLGNQWVPKTTHAYSYAILCERVHELVRSNRFLALKLPNGCGGRGNLFLDAAPLRDMNLRDVDLHLRMLFPSQFWPDDMPMLIEAWEANVIDSASIQTWIPPIADGKPIIEGVFSQMIQSDEGRFVGCSPVQLPKHLEKSLFEATSSLLQLFQYMRYVGRCSFDFLVIGDSPQDARLEFIECNGRWGGTSVPMTTVRRLFGDSSAQSSETQAFAAVTTDGAFSSKLEFADVIRNLHDIVWRKTLDVEHRWLIPFNPNRIRTHGGLNWIVLGRDMNEVRFRVNTELPRRLSLLTSPTMTNVCDHRPSSIQGVTS